MKFVTKSLIAGLVIVAGAAFAQTKAIEPNVIERQALMSTIGGSTKILGDMATGKAPFDAAAAEAAKAAMIAASAEIAAKFEVQATDPASEAKPEIWTNWNDFVAKGMALNAAATAIDVASLDTVKAGMGQIGGSCADCHRPYRY